MKKIEGGEYDGWTELSGVEFLEVCDGKYKNYPKYRELYFHDDNGLYLGYITFHKILVKGEVKFRKDFITDSSIQLREVYFEDSVEVNGKFKGLINFIFVSFQGYFSLFQCEFLGPVSFSKSSIPNTTLDNPIFHHGIVISDCKLGGFEIRDGKFENHFNFHNNTHSGKFRIYSGRYDHLAFYSGGFEDYLTIEGGLYDYLYFGKTTFSSNLSISGGFILQQLDFNHDFIGDIEIYEGEKGKLFIDTIFFRQSKKSDINIQSGRFNEIHFEDSNSNSSSVVRINSVKFKEISFSSYSNRGYVSLVDIEAQSFYWEVQTELYKTLKNHSIPPFEEDFEGWEKIYNKKDANSKLKFEKSSLGKVEFINCNLESFDEFQFESSNMLGIFLAGTKMPKTMVASDEQKRLGYGQLKEVYAKQGDKLESTRYYAREMLAYWQTLFWPPKTLIWNLINGEQITLTLNAISNAFGTSILVAFFFTVGVSIGMFSAYLHVLDVNCYPSQWLFNLDHFGYYVEFFSPIHRFDFMEDVVKPNGPAKAIDFTARLFISYGIYQFIQAFRKHGRR